MKDYPEELQKAAGSRHQKWKYPKNISSSATVQNDVKYVRLWTEAEDKILREYYAAEGSKVRYRLNQRSAESCRGRAAALGLTYSGANRKWSSSEDEILRTIIRQKVLKFRKDWREDPKRHVIKELPN